MQSGQYKLRKTHVVRLEMDEDLLEQLTTYCDEQEINAGQVQVIGSVQCANIGFYDQDDQIYEDRFVDEPMELIQGSGNVSYLEDERFVHLHGTFSTQDHTIVSGHLFDGTVVFAAEAVIQELAGPPLERHHDDDTGLNLWQLSS